MIKGLLRTGVVLLLLMMTAVSGYSQKKVATVPSSELLAKLDSTTDDSLRAAIYEDLGRSLFTEKKYNEAITYFKLALSFPEKKHDREAMARLYFNTGHTYAALRAAPDARAALLKAKAYASVKGLVLPKVYTDLILLENTTGNISEVLEYAQQLLTLARERSDHHMEGLAHNYIGYGYHVYGNIEKARESYALALQQYDLAGDSIMRASLQINMGEYFIGKNNPDSASLYFNQALKTYTAIDDKAKLALVYERLGGVYLLQDNYDGLFRLSEKSMSLAREMDDKKLLSFYGFQRDNYKLARMLRDADSAGITALGNAQRDELRELIRNMTTNLEIYRNETVNYQELSKMYRSLTQAQSMNRDFENALRSYGLSSAYQDSFASEEHVRQFATIDAKYAFERSSDSLRLAEDQKRLQLQKEIALNALKFEYEKKRALARTEEERKRLLLEETFKREAIENEYIRNRDLSQARYNQSMAVAKAEKDKQALLSKAEIRRLSNIRNLTLAGACFLLLFAAGAIWAYIQKRKDNRKIALEKKRSDELLLNILPADVAEELKADGHSEARRYNETTVLFTDFVNFTAISEHSEPEQLLRELNVCFTAFDGILERYGLEKIKTIGDAYLAVSGLPKPDTRHAGQAIYAALDIIAFMEQRKQETTSGFEIRIGINSGPLVAGIVGVKKFAYDIWGDTVNMASRMESNSEAGRINISAATYALVKDQFDCTHRGKINAKNKGEVDMYFVNGKK